MMNQKENILSKNKLPLKTKIQWGMGGLSSYFLMNAASFLAFPIYQIAMKIDPMKLGLILAIPRLFDMFSDPVMGNISDNTHTRWGRRRPYILVGALICVVSMPLLWILPFDTENMNLMYIFVIMTIYYMVGYTMYLISVVALGYELTDDYDERTKVWAWQMYIGFIGMLTFPWIYKLCFLPIFGGSEIKGAVYISIGMGIIVLFGISFLLRCRETFEHQNQKAIHLISAIKYTIQNKAFLILMAIKFVIQIGVASVATLGLYLNIYYVCGSKPLAATITGLQGSLCALASYVSLPLLTWLSVRTSKRFAMAVALAIALTGNASLWLTLTPTNPYLQLISIVIANMGMIGCWLMVFSMTADVCDEDELKTGLRREGLYSAGSATVDKVSITIATALTGAVLAISGYNSLTADTQGVSLEVITRMKTLYVGGQCFGILLGLLGCFLYPITREVSERTRLVLDNRKKTADTEVALISE